MREKLMKEKNLDVPRTKKKQNKRWKKTLQISLM